jgi:type II secretory pathway component GspD/PulD (secretin)
MTASEAATPSSVSTPAALRASAAETRTYLPPPADLHSERVAVRFGDPRRLADLLTEVFDLHHGAGSGDVRAVLVDGATAELVVVATDAGVAAVRRLLAPGCTDAPAEDARVEVVPLAHARANSVVHTLTPMAPRGARIVPDEPTNALVISGSAAERATVIALAKSLDVSPAAP